MLLCWLLKQEHGLAGIMAVIVMTLMGVLGGAFISLSSTEINISKDYRNGVAAQYLAEAGVQWAIVQLKADGTYVGSRSYIMNSGTATEGDYIVKVADSGSTRTITSTGTAGNGNIAAKRQVVLTVAPYGVYSYPVYSSTSVTVNGGGRLAGGSAGSQGSVTSNGYVQGGTQPNQRCTFPSFSGINYNSSPQLSQNINSSESLSNLAGTYYVNNNFNVSGDLASAANSTVTIYVNGNVTINGGAHITGNFMIIATGAIDVNGDVNKAILIAGGTNDAHVNARAHLYGSIITNGKLIINGTVTYDEDIIQAFGFSSGSLFTVNSYNNHS